ncbi:hypothetical protein [Aquabacter cavernae]|uniref:hypothetical protein n=1 Tax=Aquabacter cavernae TaxID=2496029 RepID=UPI000F8EFEC1|nr:hypothetical protein [Aquabacter cavernae]
MNHLSHVRTQSAPSSGASRTPDHKRQIHSDMTPAVSAALRQQHQVRRVDPCRDQQQRDHQKGEC